MVWRHPLEWQAPTPSHRTPDLALGEAPLLPLNWTVQGPSKPGLGAPRGRWRRSNFSAWMGEYRKPLGVSFNLRASVDSDSTVHKIGFMVSILQMKKLRLMEVKQRAWPAVRGWWAGLNPKGVWCLVSSRVMQSETTARPPPRPPPAEGLQAALPGFDLVATSLKLPTPHSCSPGASYPPTQALSTL